MSRTLIAVLAVSWFALAASATAHKPTDSSKRKDARKDPAFRQGYDEGYREGAKDAAGLSNSYKDEASPQYREATDGYTPLYGDRQRYQRRFRRGYLSGYKAGWDFNAGQFCSLGCGGGGP